MNWKSLDRSRETGEVCGMLYLASEIKAAGRCRKRRRKSGANGTNTAATAERAARAPAIETPAGEADDEIQRRRL